MASVNANAAVKPPKSLQMMPSKSSFISSFEYDEANMTLTAHLKSGAIYQYKFVVPSEWVALQTSQNHSKHWASFIRYKKLSVKVKSAKAPRADLKHKVRMS